MTSSSPLRRATQLVSLRALLLSLVLCALACWFLRFLNAERPVQTWLFVDLALIWGYDLLLSLACASFGLGFVERVCGQRSLPFLEKVAFALPCGLIAFVAGMYFGGFLGWYGRVFALALPGVLLAIGLPGLRDRLRVNLRGWPLRRPLSVANLAASGCGVLGIGLLYLGLLTPDAVNYDASWNHLVIAQDYARAGRITPLIGDWVKNVPHLGSIVNTWAFLVPGLKQAPLRWMQALHNEFTTFLWSLVAIAAAVRRLAERAEARAGWAAIFLFPSLFVYDGNMGAAADHYLALFSVPVLLAGLRLLEGITWRRAVLLGWLAGGALLTKLHAVYLLIPLSLLIGARVVWIALHRRDYEPTDERLSKVLIALAAGGGMAIALLGLHFGKNAVFYKNPFYPMAQGRFPSVPTLPDAQLQMDYLFGDWRWHPPEQLSDRLHAAAKMMFTFSFLPHYTFNGNVPTFGSLFTLLSPVVFFLRGARRLALAVVIMMAAVFTWANTFWVDRSLQTFLPALAAVTGALIVRAWELGPLVRAPLLALIGLQVVWGGDHYFSGNDRIQGSIDLIRSAMAGRAESRFDGYRRDYRALGAALPENALVMLHNNHVMLGIDRPVLLDWAGYQAVFDYRQYKSPRDLHERLEQLGVTHVVYLPGARSAPTKQEEIIFDSYARLNQHATESFGFLRVFPVGKKPARLERPLQVLAWNLPNYVPGLYPIEALNSNDEMPPKLQVHPAPTQLLTGATDPLPLLGQADALIARAETQLPQPLRDVLNAHYVNVRSHGSWMLYVAKKPGLGSLK